MASLDVHFGVTFPTRVERYQISTKSLSQDSLAKPLHLEDRFCESVFLQAEFLSDSQIVNTNAAEAEGIISSEVRDFNCTIIIVYFLSTDRLPQQILFVDEPEALSGQLHSD